MTISLNSIFSHYPFHGDGDALRLQPDPSILLFFQTPLHHISQSVQGHIHLNVLPQFKTHLGKTKFRILFCQPTACSDSVSHSFTMRGHLASRVLSWLLFWGGLIFSFLFLNTLMQSPISFYSHFPY